MATTINIGGANCTSYNGTAAHGSMSVVGTTFDGNFASNVVCRYKFTTPETGAESIAFKTTNATVSVRGSSSSDDGIGCMRFAISTSASAYVNYRGNGGYAITSYSYGNFVQGRLGMKLMPNTTYYLWVFAASNFPGFTRFNIGGCTVTLTGAYGTASAITADNGVFGSDIPISLANSVAGVTNTLTVSCGGIIKTLGTKSSAERFTWTPALEEYGPAITNAKTASATITCTTYYGNTAWGTSTKTIVVSFPASESPAIIDAAITYDAHGTGAEFFSCFVQGYSKAKVTVLANAKHGATISRYEVSINGETVSGASNVLISAAVSTPGVVSATIKVIDGRGFSASVTKTFTVEPYAMPKLTNVDLHRSDDQGAETEDGTYLFAYAIGNISSVAGQNSMSMSVAFKTTQGSYGTETAMASGLQSVIPGLDPDVTYVARITITDAVGNSASAIATINTRRWAMKFNATGTAVAFGKAPESDKVIELPHDWEVIKRVYGDSVVVRALFSDDELSADKIRGVVPVSSGGTGANSPSGAREALGLGGVATLNSIKSQFTVETRRFISSRTVVVASSNVNGTLDVSKEGWLALGPIGHYLQSSNLSLVWSYMSAENTYRWSVGNPSTSDRTISDASVAILYVKQEV